MMRQSRRPTERDKVTIKAKRRDAHLDALKCLAILAVIAGHAIAVPVLTAVAGPDRVAFRDGYMLTSAAMNPLYSVIQSFSLPLFAFVSGLLLNDKSLERPLNLLRRRGISLLLPYAVWTSIAILMSAPPDLQRAARSLIDPEVGAAWFLYALFVCYALAALAWRLFDRSARALWIIAIAVACSVLLPLPNLFGLRNVSLLFPFFVMGHQFKWRPKTWRHVLGLLAVYIATLALTFPTTVGGDRYWFEPVRHAFFAAGLQHQIFQVYLLSVVYHAARYMCAASGILFVVWAYTNASVSPLIRWQAFVGRRSLGLYLIHQPLQAPLIAAGLTNSWALFAVLTCASLVLTLLIERIPLVRTFLLGIGRPRPTPEANATSEKAIAA